MLHTPIRAEGLAVKGRTTLTLAAVLTALLAPLAPVAGADPSPVRTDFETTEPTGAFVLHATNPAGITFDGYVNNSIHPYKNLSYEIYTFLPDGTIFGEAANDRSAPFAGKEGGVAYAGALNYNARSPHYSTTPNDRTVEYFGVWRVSPPELWLVVAWIGAEDTFSVEIDWKPGTVVENAAEGSMSFFTPRDLNQGVRAHAGGTVYANVADGVTHAPGNAQTFGVVTWSPYNLPARGKLTVDYGWQTLVADYDQTTEWFDMEDGPCWSWPQYRHVFTTSSPVSLRFDYIGATAGPDLFTLALVTFPPGTLPEPTWEEWRTPSLCEIFRE